MESLITEDKAVFVLSFILGWLLYSFFMRVKRYRDAANDITNVTFRVYPDGPIYGSTSVDIIYKRRKVAKFSLERLLNDPDIVFHERFKKAYNPNTFWL